MKMTKYVSLMVAMIGSASAATIAVSAGLGGTSGLVVLNADGIAMTGQTWFAVGSFATAPTIADPKLISTTIGTMNIFANGLTAAASPFKLAQSFTNITNPDLFNSKVMYFALGNGTTQQNSTQFALFTMTALTAFPADITGATSVNLTMANVTSVATLANGGVEIDTAGPDRIRLVGVPEPSAALLGALGALGLLRRRRI